MKIIYAGTPEFAVPALRTLVASRHQVVAVYTQPDRPAGRGRRLQASPVKQFAEQHELPVMQPVSFKSADDIATLRAFDADLMVVAAYGLLLPQAVLDAPTHGCVNIHASILPRWRGAAPIQRALLAGDQQTGITLMQMDAGLDTGAMLATATLAIGEGMTAAQLHDRLQEMGAQLLMDNLDAIEQGGISGQRQDDAEACYASKLNRQEAEIDWRKPAAQLDREIRAFNPWPVSFSMLQGKNVKLWSCSVEHSGCDQAPGTVLSHDRQGVRVCTGEGVLVIHEMQFAGKKRSHVSQVLNANNLANAVFGL